MNAGAAETHAPPPAAESWPAGPTPPSRGWTRKKFFVVLAFVLVFHFALIFLFGTKKPVVPRVVTAVPHLRLADPADEFIALGDPTLFARPNVHDGVTLFWRKLPAVPPPPLDWSEDPRYLEPRAEDFGAVLHQYVQDNRPEKFPLNFKPEPKLELTAPPFEAALPDATTLQISGDLSGRRLSATNALPSLPRNDVIAPSTVRALVDREGNVFSTAILAPNQDSDADQLALKLARALHFAPAPRITFGDITFIWHTVPLTTTNEPVQMDVR